jgi:uncharacterized protein (TIGR02147 family)
MSSINVFEYTNYRSYLSDKYDELKKVSSSFSYRFFSKQCGYSSPNYLKLVTNGDRNLSIESISKFSVFFKMNKKESEYFKKLVLFNQTKNSQERKELAEQILKFSVFTRIHPLAKDQFLYTSNWYYVAVREILQTKKVKLDAKTISELIRPRVSQANIENVLDTLLRLKMIRKKDNRYVQINELVSTGDEVSYAGVAEFHIQMMELASQSIDSVDRNMRDISGVTVSLSSESIEELKIMIQKFRKNVLELSERDKNKQSVYQLNLQMFPLSEVEK